MADPPQRGGDLEANGVWYRNQRLGRVKEEIVVLEKKENGGGQRFKRGSLGCETSGEHHID